MVVCTKINLGWKGLIITPWGLKPNKTILEKINPLEKLLS